jgi:hypothetical protein
MPRGVAVLLIVATPLLVCGQALVDYLWVERSLGKEPA